MYSHLEAQKNHNVVGKVHLVNKLRSKLKKTYFKKGFVLLLVTFECNYTVVVQFCQKNRNYEFVVILQKIKNWTKIEQLDLAIAKVTQTGNPLVLGILIMQNLFRKSS